MNEDDTYRKLARLPYTELAEIIYNLQEGEDMGAVLEEYHWTNNEFILATLDDLKTKIGRMVNHGF